MFSHVNTLKNKQGMKVVALDLAVKKIKVLLMYLKYYLCYAWILLSQTKTDGRGKINSNLLQQVSCVPV